MYFQHVHQVSQDEHKVTFEQEMCTSEHALDMELATGPKCLLIFLLPGCFYPATITLFGMYTLKTHLLHEVWNGPNTTC